jgi:endonuclease/exonuclease/phosphatase family metal-dependent hydrolase
VRVATLNLWGRNGAWPERRAVLRDGFARLRPDVVAFQEAVELDDYDQVLDLLGPGFQIARQAKGLVDEHHVVLASRFPITDAHELDQQLTSRTADFSPTTLMAEIDAPPPIGPLLLVGHFPAWKPEHEYERELQTVAAARAIEERAGSRHVVLAGDLDATPDAASIRFLRGRQSLHGVSVHYVDAWDFAHPGEPGPTFTPANPLVMEDSPVTVEEPRRIDYVLVRAGASGPTLRIDACERLFDEPVDGVWASDHFGVVADLAPFAPADGQ